MLFFFYSNQCYNSSMFVFISFNMAIYVYLISLELVVFFYSLRGFVKILKVNIAS